MTEWIDVSSNNGSLIGAYLPICDGVIVKATQGAGYVNPYHDTQVAQARAAGKRVGHYHWTEQWLHTPRQEVDHFLSFTHHLPGDILAFDVEDQRTPAGDWSAWVAEALAYCRDRTGINPLLYSFGPYLRAHLTSGALT